METVEIGGMELQYEKLDPENFKTGSCAFKVIDQKGDKHFLVVCPRYRVEQPEWARKEVLTPKDGIICASCPDEMSALMVASSVQMAARMSIAHCALDKVFGKGSAAERDKYDIEALNAEIERLRKEGKSPVEVIEELRHRASDFTKGNP